MKRSKGITKIELKIQIHFCEVACRFLNLDLDFDQQICNALITNPSILDIISNPKILKLY